MDTHIWNDKDHTQINMSNTYTITYKLLHSHTEHTINAELIQSGRHAQPSITLSKIKNKTTQLFHSKIFLHECENLFTILFWTKTKSKVFFFYITISIKYLPK